MSAQVGSIADNRAGRRYSYRANTSAVNNVCKTFDIHLRARSGDKALEVGYDPGTVKTDLNREFWGGVAEGKLSSPEYAAKHMVDVIIGSN